MFELIRSNKRRSIVLVVCFVVIVAIVGAVIGAEERTVYQGAADVGLCEVDPAGRTIENARRTNRVGGSCCADAATADEGDQPHATNGATEQDPFCTHGSFLVDSCILTGVRRPLRNGTQ